MAGKFRGASRGVELGDVTGVSGVTDRINIPPHKGKLIKAYAEGRAGGTNPHPATSEAGRAYLWGFNNRGTSAYQYETAVP